MIRTGHQKLDNQLLLLPVAAASEIFAGKLVAIGADGYAIQAAKAASLTIAGVCEEYADNRNGEAGAASVTVRRGAFVFHNTSGAGEIKVTDILKDCYIEDAVTLTKTATGSSKAGKILAVEPDGITIEIL